MKDITCNAWYCGNWYATLGNIANMPMAGKSKMLLRFRATRSGHVESFDTWWRYREAGYSTGDRKRYSYSEGDGGRYLVTIQGDHHSGRPLRTVYAQGEFLPDIARYPIRGKRGSQNQFRTLKLDSSEPLVAGQRYNVVFQNIANDPRANYISLNGVFSRNTADPHQSQANDYVRNELNRLGSNGVLERPVGTLLYFPQWAIKTDQGAMGQPYQYGDVWTGQHKIGGTKRVCQFITPKQDVPVHSLNFFATRIRGTGNLSVNIFHAERLVEQLHLDHRSITPMTTTLSGGNDFKSFSWVQIATHMAMMQRGVRYCFEFSAPAGCEYYVSCSVKAGGYTGIPAVNVLTQEGYARYSEDAGATWKDWQVRGTPSKKVDLSLYTLG